MVNRPIVAHLRTPAPTTTRRVLAPSHQRCSPVQMASLGHELRRRGTSEMSGRGEEVTDAMSGVFFASFKVPS